MKLAIGLIIKNGEQFVDEWIKSAERIGDIFLVVDSGVKEKERNKLINHPKTKQYLIQKNMERNQSRDYQRILDMAKEENCDWVWNIDIDEIVPKFDIEMLKAYLLNAKDVSVGFPLFEMRNDDEHYVMVKDCTSKLKHARLCHKCYKVLSHFEFNQKDKHGTAIPHNCLAGEIFPIPIKHFGHYNKTLREEKKKQYLEHNFKDMSELNATWMKEDDEVEIKKFDKKIKEMFPPLK